VLVYAVSQSGKRPVSMVKIKMPGAPLLYNLDKIDLLISLQTSSNLQMVQVPITNFFPCTTIEKGKRNFIYDTITNQAWFSNSTEESDTFLVEKCGVKLWRRGAQSSHMTFSAPDTRIPVPLLKSHFQKAIRRKRTDLALQTLYSLFETSPIDVIRRLPIIAVEDVRIFKGLSTIVWLMMAEKFHRVTEDDFMFIQNYVVWLCETDICFRDKRYECGRLLSHKDLVMVSKGRTDDVLALRYRIEYGGSKGDMAMLQRAMEFYITSHIEERKVKKLDGFNKHIILSMDRKFFIREAIDFHPYPWILKKLAGRVEGITYNEIKSLIWCVDSCWNARKPFIVRRSKELGETEAWKIIATMLGDYRVFIIDLVYGDLEE
jgi:hypothetical protein